MAQRGSNNDTAMSWEALAGLAESRAIGKGSDPDATSPTGRRVPVRDLRRTADRAPKMYAPIDNRVAKKRAGYDTDSDEEGASPVAAITANAINLNAPPPRPIRAPHQGKFNSGGGEEKLETEYMEVDNLLASPFGDRGDRPSPKRGQVKSPSRTGTHHSI